MISRCVLSTNLYFPYLLILPRSNDVDMVVFSIYANGYKQCSDTAKGTYITPVPYFAQGYINQKQQDTEDQGQEYELPSAAMYAYCTPQQINQQWFYLQLGCADGNSQKLAVNIYTDNVCTNRSVVDGMDDANIDVSAIQPTFKRCAMCVNWYDHENEVDDGYYFSRMLHAPLCSTAWKYKETCDTKCQRLAMEKKQKSGWSASDNVLLAILIAFGLIMVGLIMRKREKMSNKDTLLEQAALSAAGLQQPHVLGIFVLTVLVIAVFALLGLKNITWALLLIMNTALFSYLMKLTITSSMNTADAIIGPDGTIIRKDSDESSMVSSAARSGTYNLPVID